VKDFFNNELVNNFEEMVEGNESIYFESDEFCEIISFYLDIYDYEYALKALDVAFSLYPSNIDLKIKQLEYFVGIENLHIASKLIEELKELCFADMDYLIATARYWSLRKFPYKAIDFFTAALANEEDEDYIYNCLGNEYLEVNEPTFALNSYKKALEYNMNDEYSLFSCIHCYEVMHQHRECILFLKQFIDLHPYSEEAWFQLGLQYLNLNRHEKALHAFDYATVINPKSIAGYTQKAFCYEKLNKWLKAIETYEESLDFDDTAAFTYFKIGQAYNKLRKPIQALNSFQKAVKEDPQFDKAWFEISDIYDSLGNNEEALHYIKKALDIESKEVSYWKKYAYLNIQLGKYEEASDSFEIIMDLEPTHFYNWLAYSELLISLGDYSKAALVLHKSFKHFNRAELYYQLGNCYFLLKEGEKGENFLKMALKLNPMIKEEMQEKYSILLRDNKKYKNPDINLNM
jgi:tetratricopeptide (TPR) repeat protein